MRFFKSTWPPQPPPKGAALDNEQESTSPPDAGARAKQRKSRHASKVPAGALAEPLNIVILGASFGGLSCAHAFFDEAISRLGKAASAPTYRLVVVSPSTHIFWNIAAPRALVKDGLIKNSEMFIAIEPGFHRHKDHEYALIQGQCVGVDASARHVTIELIGNTAQRRVSLINKRISKVVSNMPTNPDGSVNLNMQTIPYHALIMATGSSADSDLLTLHGPHLSTIGAMNAFHAKVEAAKSIVVCGGGCSGVEVAGQLATYYNWRSHWPTRRPVKNPKRIILITGSDQLLPQLKPVVGAKAEKKLRELGVQVRKRLRVVAAREGFDLTGQTKVELDDDTSLIVDLYMACTGVRPNSRYVPAALRDERGYVRTNSSSLRVDLAGPRTYAIGDVASYSQNYVLDVYAAVPVLMHNLTNDLLAHELKLASPYGGNQELIDELVDEQYVQREVDSQLCPISRFGGAGILMGIPLKSIMVHLLKGHDYRVCKAKMVTVNGGNPYAAVPQLDKYH